MNPTASTSTPGAGIASSLKPGGVVLPPKKTAEIREVENGFIVHVYTEGYKQYVAKDVAEVITIINQSL